MVATLKTIKTKKMKLFSNWLVPNPGYSNHKSKLMLEKSLNEAFGFDEVLKITKLIPLYIDDFCPSAFVIMLKKANYRLEISVFVQKIFKTGRIYPAWKLNHLFSLAKNEFEIDAILYHVYQNGVAYSAARDTGLQIFENMAKRRRIALIDTIFSNLKTA